ncbi:MULTISPECIES: hypothetical protein [unclassified Microcoleus]|uniref:hypothetical protein n=1 Tax=unclassified Microcoleus TaxID=2642155 RepID=UPI002FD6FB46
MVWVRSGDRAVCFAEKLGLTERSGISVMARNQAISASVAHGRSVNSENAGIGRCKIWSVRFFGYNVGVTRV